MPATEVSPLLPRLGRTVQVPGAWAGADNIMANRESNSFPRAGLHITMHKRLHEHPGEHWPALLRSLAMHVLKQEGSRA